MRKGLKMAKRIPKKSSSDFGKGFVYSLILFTHHFDNDMASSLRNKAFVMSKTEDERRKILCDNPESSHNYGWNKEVKWWYEKIVPIRGSVEKTLSSDIEVWANGASDHLYELEIPNSMKGTKIDKLASQIRDVGLKMGHGFDHEIIWTINHFNELWLKVKKIGILVDKELGLKPIKGQWE